MTYIIFCFDSDHVEKISQQLFLVVIKSSLLSALFVLIGISILVAVGFLIAFLWSVRNGQFDDDYTPSIRILFDDNNSKRSSSTSSDKK